MGDNGEAKRLGALGRKPMLEKVREHAHTEWDKEIGQKSKEGYTKLTLE